MNLKKKIDTQFKARENTNKVIFCFTGPMPTDLKIGTSCKSSLQCLLFIPNSHCDWDERVCTCQPYYILYNQTNCLPGIRSLFI
jgi:hypothetical protein